MVLLMSATANFSVGPVVYTIVSEVPSTRLRAKSIILARNAYNAINIAFVNVVSYRQLNPAEWNWGPKAAFFWAGINALFSTYLYFRLRECSSFSCTVLPPLSPHLLFFSSFLVVNYLITWTEIIYTHTCVCVCVYVCVIAETKGRTYAELDILFKNKVSARRFAKTRIETLIEGTEDAQKQQVEQIEAETTTVEHKEVHIN